MNKKSKKLNYKLHKEKALGKTGQNSHWMENAMLRYLEMNAYFSQHRNINEIMVITKENTEGKITG